MDKDNEMKVIHSCRMEWKISLFGDPVACSAENFDTAEEAKAELLKLAKRLGYTEPKWYEWWRWLESITTESRW